MQVLRPAASARLYEDAHWIDPSTQELWTSWSSGYTLPVLLLLTYRPEFIPPWTGHAHVTSLTLVGLASGTWLSMIRAIGSKPLPAEVTTQILAKTDGVPLFVEELTKAVLGVGLLKRRRCHYAPHGTLRRWRSRRRCRDSLMARLDRLGPVKEVAQIGAVIGRRSFSRSAGRG